MRIATLCFFVLLALLIAFASQENGFSFPSSQGSEQKLSNVMERAKESVESGHYRLSNHAMQRKKERDLELTDILYVLKNGYHEENRDQWSEKFSTWNYAIRGQTIDRSEARIVVSFEKKDMMIITVIRLRE